MSLTRWEPMRNFENLFDRYSRSLGMPLMGELDSLTTSDWLPRVDISENDKELVIDVEIPDVKRDDVKVSVEDGILTIQGDKKQEREESGRKFFRSERYYGKFLRSFSLPDNVDEKKIHASFKNGMLNLSIPKTGEPKHKAIEIKLD